MSVETIHLDHNNVIPQSLLSRSGFADQGHLKAVFGKMGILLVKESASLGDIILTLEEMKKIYSDEVKELDREWDDFTLSEEWLSSDL